MEKNIYCETLEIAGFYPAIKGMRNPKNSWSKSDSKFDKDKIYIGEADLKLAKTLIKAGSEHCKFMRMIQVWVDINFPRYFWSEFDTYHYNTKNSCSTMHKLFEKDKIFTLNDFYLETEFEKISINNTILTLNTLQKMYFEEINQLEKNNILASAKRLLPEGFLQLRTINTNYAEIRNIYHQRKNHRLKSEWQNTFCKWIESLPFSKELITGDIE